MVIRRIAVLGAGTMGHGIAHAAAAAGYDTVMFDVSPDVVEKRRRAVEDIVRGGVERAKVTAADGEAILARIKTTSELAHALAEADFIVEAASERIDIKLNVFADIQRLAPVGVS